VTVAIRNSLFTRMGTYSSSTFVVPKALEVSAFDNSSMHFSLTDCTFKRNNGFGDTIARFGSHGTSVLVASITRSRFERNVAPVGVLYLRSEDASSLSLDVLESRFTRNMSFEDSDLPGVSGVTSIEADGRGGGLSVTLTNTFVLKDDGCDTLRTLGSVNLSVVNSTITNNIVGNNIVGNSSYDCPGLGAALHLDGPATASLTNTILWGNHASSGADLIMSGSSGPTVDAAFSDIGDRLAPSGTFSDLGNNVDVNPQLYRTGKLQPGSPAIDTGTCTGAPTTDFEGDPRPTGASCDMGADEFVP